MRHSLKIKQSLKIKHGLTISDESRPEVET